MSGKQSTLHRFFGSTVASSSKRVKTSPPKENGKRPEAPAVLPPTPQSNQKINVAKPVENSSYDFESLEADSSADSSADGSGDGPKLSDGLTDYERKRLERIRHNQEVLMSMGIRDSATKITTRSTQPLHPVKRKVVPVQGEGGRRRSSRLSGEGVGPAPGRDQASEPPEPGPEPEYGESALARYSFETAPLRPACDWRKQKLVGFELAPFAYNLPIKRCYSISFLPQYRLLAAGGHGGDVAVFAEPDDEQEVEPASAFQAHSGWISGCRLIDLDGRPVLLTTANDNCLKLFDVRKSIAGQSGGALQPLWLSRPHRTGIFTMDVHGATVLTGSKDTTIALSRIGAASAEVVQRFEEFHGGVVKCVRFRDQNTFASTGNDLRICVADIRTRLIASSIERAHDNAINSVSWHPSNDYLLLSASFDPFIKLFDIRKPTDPLLRFTGHFRPGVARSSSIFHPEFVALGSAVAVCGCGGSADLTLFSAADAAVISRGALGTGASALTASSPATEQLAVAIGGEVRIFAPCTVPA